MNEIRNLCCVQLRKPVLAEQQFVQHASANVPRSPMPPAHTVPCFSPPLPRNQASPPLMS